MLRKSKKSQAEVVVTVLLILIVLASVAIVSSFVLKLVRDNLSGTDCFKTMGQLEIKFVDGISFFNTTSHNLSITIERGHEAFNLTGILLSAGTDSSSKSFKITQGAADPLKGIYMLDSDNIELPQIGEKRTYVINMSGFLSVNKVSIAPIIDKNKQCNVADEADIETIL